jgi:uncharacterized protein (TIRG00374 family)
LESSILRDEAPDPSAQEKLGLISGKGIRLSLCIGVSALCLYLALRGADFGQILEYAQKTRPTPAIVAVLFLFLSFGARAWRWHYLLMPLRAVPVMPLFRSTMIGFMANYLLPLRAGELVRAASIGQHQRISKAGALGSIVLERVLDGITLSIFPIFLVTVLDLPSWLMWMNGLLLGIYALGIAVVILSTLRGWMDLWLNSIFGVLPQRISYRLRPLADHVLYGMRGLNRSQALVPVALLSLLCWSLHAMYYFFLFEALDLDLSISKAMILETVIGVGVMLPAGPGYVGNFQYATVLGLGLFQIAREEALAYSLVAHSLQFFPVIAVGLLFAFRGNFFLNQSRAVNLKKLNPTK